MIDFSQFKNVHAISVLTDSERGELLKRVPLANAEIELLEYDIWMTRKSDVFGVYATSDSTSKQFIPFVAPRSSFLPGNVIVVTTWLGGFLGYAYSRSRTWLGNFGDRRVHLNIEGTNGCFYHGTWSYARQDFLVIRKTKGKVQ